MSIMRRHSHGCHRLHNHIAVRLMSFVLEHRAHTRVGQQAVAFRRDVEIDGNNYSMEINQGGYVYQLAEPIHVEVLEGRIEAIAPRRSTSRCRASIRRWAPTCFPTAERSRSRAWAR
jgi:hypothetical protein